MKLFEKIALSKFGSFSKYGYVGDLPKAFVSLQISSIDFNK